MSSHKVPELIYHAVLIILTNMTLFKSGLVSCLYCCRVFVRAANIMTASVSAVQIVQPLTAKLHYLYWYLSV